MASPLFTCFLWPCRAGASHVPKVYNANGLFLTLLMTKPLSSGQ